MAKKKANSKPTILVEGKIRKGGVKPKPTCPKPNIKPSGQKPSPTKGN